MMQTDMFTVSAKQVARLDDQQLVDLLGRLLHAEARAIGLPLAGAHVPAQITIPDGGEDGRMLWSGGVQRTDFLPHRFNVFQAKATDVTVATLRAETHTAGRSRRNRKKHSVPELRPVLVDALAAGGAYIIVTTKKLTERQKKPLIAAIKAGIAATSHDPDRVTINIYDANTLAAWASHHQAVALQLNEQLGDHSLSGFKSIAMWSRREDFHAITWASDEQARFGLAPLILPEALRTKRSANAYTFDQAQAAIVAHLAEPKRAIRVSGASGLGKSRFTYSIFTEGEAALRAFDAAALIYAEYDVVGDAILQLAERYAQAGADVILVVDDCPDRIHQRLFQSVMQEGSRLRLVTIDVENRAMPAKDRLLTVEVGPSSNSLIETIIAAVDNEMDETTRRFIGDLAQGFPRMAVQGARAARDGQHPIRSAGELIERIVWGRRSPDSEAMRALETASLFDVLRIGGTAPTDLAAIAPAAAEMSATRMREHLASFSERGIVVKKGRYVQIQPLPLAVMLAARRLAALGSDEVQSFYAGLPDHLTASLLDRLRWLDASTEAQELARHLLSPNGIGTWQALDTERGARTLDRLVHILPDAAMSTLDTVFRASSHEQLLSFVAGRSQIVCALQKLAARHQTFERAAHLLLRLADAETETRYANNASGQFKSLFQLHLSGTEADLHARLAVLDEGLAASDAPTRRIAIEAAGEMLTTGHFSRSGGFEQIGSRPPIVDWHPRRWRDVWDFHEAGLVRLERLALTDTAEAQMAQNLIGTHVRGLVSAMPLERLAPTLRRVAHRVRVWNVALHGLSDWLYFDRRKAADQQHAAEVRRLFDELMPADPVDLLLLHARGWGRDFHDPDQDYDPEDRAANDHGYGEREIVRLVDVFAADQTALISCLAVAAPSKLDSGYFLGKVVAVRSDDPEQAFDTIIIGIEAHGALVDSRLMRGFLAGLDDRDPSLPRACALRALASPIAGADAIGVLQGLSLRDDDVPMLVDLVKTGRIDAAFCSHISHGRGLDAVTPDALAPFLDVLAAKCPAGCWSVLEILHMVLLDRADLPTAFATRIKAILVADGLISDATARVQDPDVLKCQLERLAEHCLIDAEFASEFARQLMNIIDLEIGPRLDFEHYSDEMLRVLIGEAPGAVWQAIAIILETESGQRRHRLDRLLAPDRDDRSGAGVLFQPPAEMYLSWAREAPNTRAAIVAAWLPLTLKDIEGRRSWHPSVLTFIDEFADADHMLGAIGWRMRPSGWSGSLVPYLEPWLPLLDQLRDHGNATLARWAIAAHDGLVQQIEAERAGDAEREIGFW